MSKNREELQQLQGNYPVPKLIHTQTVPLGLLLKKDTVFQKNGTQDP